MTVFGLQWTQATDAMVRPAGTALTHLAVTSPTNAETLAAVAQASTYAPWSGMRRCNLWDTGTPTAYYGDRCYTDTDVANMGQCMVQIPKFWYTTDHGAGAYKWYISDTGAAGTEPAGHDHDWAVHPAFIRDGVTKDYIYLSVYEGYLNGTMLESAAGVKPTDGLNIDALRTAAQLRKGAANYWEIQDYLTTSAVQLLYLVEYGHFNSQLVLSEGITNLTDDGVHCMVSNTGHTSTIGNASGQVSHNNDHDPAQTCYAMSYRGIENFYGNLMMVIDGINIKTDYTPYIADHDFATGVWAPPYTNTGLSLYDGDGYITDITTDATYDYGFLPSAVGAADKLCDMYTHAEGDHVVAAGGLWTGGAVNGAFYLNTYYSQFSANRLSGSRLMYIG